MRSIFSLHKKRAAQLVLAAVCVGVYSPALYAPVDPETGEGSRQIIFKVGTVVDAIESTIDDIASRTDASDSRLDVIESKIDVIDTNIDTLDSKVDIVDSKIDELDSKVEEMFIDFQETWTILGNQDQNSSAAGDFSNAADVDSAQLTIIQWLKTIYREQRGF